MRFPPTLLEQGDFVEVEIVVSDSHHQVVSAKVSYTIQFGVVTQRERRGGCICGRRGSVAKIQEGIRTVTSAGAVYLISGAEGATD